jgi:hypothetical protein
MPPRARPAIWSGCLLCICSLAAAGCGFDDSLTRRGFIEEGDRICGETIVAAAAQTPGTTPTLSALAQGYQGAAQGFGELEPAEGDLALRDRIVEQFTRTGRQLQGLSAGGAADPAAPVFGQAAAFGRELQGFGFTTCGRPLTAR